MLKYDLHMHTIYSRDGAIKPADAIRIARKRGLDGIAITDHGTIRGGLEAQKLKPEGIEIICGAEIKTDRGDVIGLFLNEEIRQADHMEVIEAIRRQGGVVVIPHPFDSVRSSAFWLTDKDSKKMDALEAINARCVFKRSNRMASAYADQFHVCKVGGSDAHFGAEIANAGTLVPEGEDVAEAIRKGHTVAYGRRSLPFFHVLTTALLMERRVIRPLAKTR
ncbi:putative metal-dependent phosphoesterase (PHP family) [Methanocella conradii HZ254]|uniref:Metal-dependent phosphoesterase (PHP family) n=1 Tax=Methanocella conradii (strain DSM 24694 / JCM 17849 / CGMCC 1.5162 / HZ254) TaxID=1041930 RepID=H8I673_METCZ|nr:PHP domain-containing protein [Methanocella conradii]AFD00720.1 putative metal-dependent phosphoesterase (PHP family) [Methanocella conradii HZ254]MDI6897065.1 PHP domain-containing protein [Methanocella conradii]